MTAHHAADAWGGDDGMDGSDAFADPGPDLAPDVVSQVDDVGPGPDPADLGGTSALDGAGYATPYGTRADGSAVIGEPEHDASFWHRQSTSDTCAVACQEFVLEDLTGVPHTEAELTTIAEQNGWYQPGYGTSLADVGKLLEYHGVPVERFDHAAPADLQNALASGQNVIVGVDSEEIWEAQGVLPDLDGYPGIPGQGADHAVQVTGVDYSDPGNPVVLLNDPGTASGAGSRVPMDAFLDAWADSGNFMVTAGGSNA